MSEFLFTYLQDHQAGANGGTDAFNRVAQGHSDPEVRATVSRIGAEVTEDQKALEEIMARLGVKSSLLKGTATRLGEKVGRFKPNNRILSRSPLSDLLELEVLVNAVHAKGLMWKALAALDDPRLDHAEMDRFAARAEQQHAELETLRLRQAATSLRA